ncbi:MAG: helix-turn-helix transcriptional regulator [Clostridia bacterium]|nr:helix-turn-helix transcriptional regulator [Clostridia bacterium]
MANIYCDREKEHALTVQRVKEDIMLTKDAEKVSKIFQMLSDAGRLKIVLALLKGDMCVYHLIEVCDGTQSNVSHQLRILKDNGIVKSKRLGKNVEYSIADEHIREIVEMGKAHLLCMKGKK